MFTRMFKHDGGFYDALPHEVAPMTEQGWTVITAKKPVTIEAHEPSRRGRPRKEVPVIPSFMEGADDGNSTDAD